ncbi:flavodoxin domain-containing protein [Clostridium vincentii]|uniref:Protoporphyrinogen oxidase n=1 Tax=Clostridium vincentii TaxID=52704 RepID=A0A2T0BB17_9CLOT|nr:flavodoxin domain-containing protein [Clostridium vincentii]PRR81078.1 protoporphyrinogen oxidase [Clostridium vincentii]
MKTLIIYGTNYGTAEGVAKTIKGKISDQVEMVNIKKASVPNLNDFNKIVIGSGVKIGMINKKLKSWMNNNCDEIISKKIFLFLCASTTKAEEIEKIWSANYPEKILDNATIKICVGGVLNLDKMGFFDKLIIKKVTGQNESSSTLKIDEILNLASLIEKA